jgi:hypothetical protein
VIIHFRVFYPEIIASDHFTSGHFVLPIIKDHSASVLATMIVSLPHVSKILDCERKNKARCYAPERCDTTPRLRAPVFTQRVNIRLVQPLQRFMRIHGERPRSSRIRKQNDQQRKQQ